MNTSPTNSADDWGWKGGKPGEITGTEFLSEIDRIGRARESSEWKHEEHTKLQDRAIEQLDAAAEEGKFPTDWEDADSTMFAFARLESLDIPRRLTGKMMNALGGWIPAGTPDEDLVAFARKLDEMVAHPAWLETFQKLRPEWNGSLEDLIAAARLLS